MELISDILTEPPAHDKYETLKKTLIDRCQDSEERRLDALLNKLDLGDSRPSDIFRKMESLAGDFKLINKALLKKLWLGKLPTTIQSCLISIESSQTPEELFAIADKLHDATDRIRISAVKINSDRDHIDSSIGSTSLDCLKNMMDKICSRLDKIENSQSRSGRDTNRNNRSYSRSRSQSRNTNKYETCWYHYKFGDMARSCNQPCNFKSNDAGSSKNQ